MMDMGAPYDQTELVSFHTISKVCLSRLPHSLYSSALQFSATWPDDKAATAPQERHRDAE